MPSKQTHSIVMPPGHMDNLYNSGNPLVRLVHRHRLDHILALVSKGNNLKVLDAGCGEGHFLEKLSLLYPDYSCFGIDLTREAIEKAKIRCPKATLALADIHTSGFADETFDAVICSEVIEHVSDYKTVLEELKRVLKKSGAMIISFPNELNWTVCRFLLGRRPLKVPDHINSFSPQKMSAAVNLSISSQRHFPPELPFCLSLNCIMKFRK